MEWLKTQEDYQQYSVVREGDDLGWGHFYGYVIVVKSDLAALVYVSHCSCNQTWYKMDVEGGTVMWQGQLSELIRIARERLDPDMPSRVIDTADCDSKYLVAAYETFLKLYGNVS